MAIYKEAFLSIAVNRGRGIRIGGEFSRVFIAGRAYLDRFIGYVGGTIRLHRFWRGDDDRASHDHPWSWWITFPFTSYREDVYSEGWFVRTQVVKAWRFHFRRGTYEHIVLGRADWKNEPFWTVVITGRASRDWGFYPSPGEFVPWKAWGNSMEQKG